MTRPTCPRAFRRAAGFSLIELMVAMVIGLLLLGGLVTLMVNSKKNYAQQDYAARLQENARFAVQFLSYDIRMAGYYGCSNEIINDTVAAITPVENGANPDAVTITYGEPYEPGTSEEITMDTGYSPYSSPNTLVLSEAPSTWNAGDQLVIGDCGSASVATIDSVDTSNGTVEVTPPAGGLGRVYDPSVGAGGPITVRRLVTSAYTIQTGRSGIPTLMRNGQELVEGIENIQLLYQALGGGNFADGSATTPGNLAAVQLGALIRSVSNENLDNREYGSGADITEDDGGYTLLNQDVSGVTGTIRGQRRVFNSTLAVRNRPL